MATIYKRTNSPFWWIKYRKAGKLLQESTGLRWSDKHQSKNARRLRIERTLEERKHSSLGTKEQWSNWVPEYLSLRYHGKDRTHSAIKSRFDRLMEYFDSKGITNPQQITRDLCFDYVHHRTKEDKVSLNTALHEIKVLNHLMKEALNRGYCLDNPCRNLGIKEDQPEEKPELKDSEIAAIRDTLRNPNKHFDDYEHWLSEDSRDWMIVAFEIALYQGCRLMETSIPVRDIDFENNRMIFRKTKGNRPFTTALHPELKPFLRKLVSDGRTTTCTLPSRPSDASRIWWRFFKKLKMKHLCFHCTRVTVITRMARAGVPISQAMRYVNHASETIHRVYQRLSVDDLDHCVQAVKYDRQPQSRGSASSR